MSPCLHNTHVRGGCQPIHLCDDELATSELDAHTRAAAVIIILRALFCSQLSFLLSHLSSQRKTVCQSLHLFMAERNTIYEPIDGPRQVFIFPTLPRQERVFPKVIITVL